MVLPPADPISPKKYNSMPVRANIDPKIIIMRESTRNVFFLWLSTVTIKNRAIGSVSARNALCAVSLGYNAQNELITAYIKVTPSSVSRIKLLFVNFIYLLL
jgi:hypothetical protein